MDLITTQRLLLKSERTKQSKMRNVKTVVDGITFDSKLEARRYGELKLLKLAGEIVDFQLQVPHKYLGTKGQVLFRYIADFVVTLSDGSEVIEDTKGFVTPIYRLKKKLIEDQHGITIKEIYARTKARRKSRRPNMAKGTTRGR